MKSHYFHSFFRGCLVTLLSVLFSFVLLFLAVFLLIGQLGSTASDVISSSSVRTEFISGNAHAECSIAVIDITGVISSEGVYSGAYTKDILPLIRLARETESIKAIIINLDTPGGEVTAADEIYHELTLCEKPVIAFMNSMAASGGYYIAAAADWITASKYTLTGSIGVIISSYDLSGLLDWAKIKPEFYTSGKMKTILSPAKPTTPEEAEIIQKLVDNAYLGFAEVVSKGRNIPLESITKGEIGDGRIFDGEQALQRKLIDQLGYFSDAEEKALQLTGLDRDSCIFERLLPSSSVFSGLLNYLGAGTSSPELVNSTLEKSNIILPKAGILYFLPFAG